MTPTPEEVLADCKLRLDGLLPERDAAVFLSNVGKKGDAWEQAFVEALAIAYKSTDALAASQDRVRELEREVCTCPWPADAMVHRHLLSCRLMEMEHTKERRMATGQEIEQDEDEAFAARLDAALRGPESPA